MSAAPVTVDVQMAVDQLNMAVDRLNYMSLTYLLIKARGRDASTEAIASWWRARAERAVERGHWRRHAMEAGS